MSIDELILTLEKLAKDWTECDAVRSCGWELSEEIEKFKEDKDA